MVRSESSVDGFAVVSRFWTACVVPGPRITRRHLYAAFTLWWHQQTQVDLPLTFAAFNRQIAHHVAAGGQLPPVHGSGYWYGITVPDEWHPYPAYRLTQ